MAPNVFNRFINFITGSNAGNNASEAVSTTTSSLNSVYDADVKNVKSSNILADTLSGNGSVAQVSGDNFVVQNVKSNDYIANVQKVLNENGIYVSKQEVNQLLDIVYGGLGSAGTDEEDVKFASEVIVETVNYLKDKDLAVTIENIQANIEKVRLAKATNTDVDYNGKVVPLDERLNKIMQEKGFATKEEALKFLLETAMDLHNNEDAGVWNDTKTWSKNAWSAIRSGKLGRAFRSAEATRKVQAAQTWANIIKGATNEELVQIQKVLTEYAENDPKFQAYAKEALEEVQVEIATRNPESADEVNTLATFSENKVKKAEARMSSVRTDAGARKANQKLDNYATQLYAIRNKLANGEALTEEDKNVLRLFNINPDGEITVDLVQSKINGLLTDAQAAQTFGSGLNNNITEETLNQIIHNNTRHENGQEVADTVSSMVEENSDDFSNPEAFCNKVKAQANTQTSVQASESNTVPVENKEKELQLGFTQKSEAAPTISKNLQQYVLNSSNEALASSETVQTQDNRTNTTQNNETVTAEKAEKSDAKIKTAHDFNEAVKENGFISTIVTMLKDSRDYITETIAKTRFSQSSVAMQTAVLRRDSSLTKELLPYADNYTVMGLKNVTLASRTANEEVSERNEELNEIYHNDIA